jgi:hypothetical protein
MQLASPLARRLEAELVQHLLHRDLGAEHVEVDARHKTTPSMGPIHSAPWEAAPVFLVVRRPLRNGKPL